jgi:hypothetical protein
MVRLALALVLAMIVLPVAAQTPVPALPFRQWSKFTDPNEGSFSIEVPVGWRVSGGLQRRNALQFWPWLTAVTPDGNTILAFGDPALQSYVLPTPGLAMTGFREGSLYNGGLGTMYVVSGCIPGQNFAVGYGNQQLPRFCTDVRVTAAADRPDLAARFASGGFSQTTAGEARFTCRRNGTAMEAYVFCATSLLRDRVRSLFWRDAIKHQANRSDVEQCF